MHIQNSLLLLAAMGASNAAGRATLKHRHANLHKERDLGDIVHATINGVDVSWTNTYDGSSEAGDAADAAAPEASSAPAAAVKVAASSPETEAAGPTSTPAATASSSPSSSSSSSSSSDDNVVTSYTPFCKANNKRATVAQIAYVGNVGSEWGCNQILVAEDVVDQYDYTIKVTGERLAEPWKVVCTNKIGPEGKIDGWYNGYKAVEFTLAPGATQYVAVDANTQGICAAAPGDAIPVDAQGGYASTWFEFDFANESNGGWSGADISSIQAQAAGLEIQGMQTCHSDVCSAIFEGPLGPVIDNAFDITLKLADGLGLNIPAGKTQIDLVLGYSE